MRLPSGESANEVAKMPWVPETESAVRGWVARHANPRDSSVDLEGDVPYVETSLPESSSVRRVGYFFAKQPWRVTAVVFWLPKHQAAPALGPPEGTWWGMPLYRTDTEGDLYAPDAHALVWVLDPAMRLPPQRRVDLPRDVPIKTRTRTFHRDLLFAIDGGKLWFKRNPAHGGTLGEAWRLFGTGLPTARPGAEPFVAPAPLVEVSADADDLLVVDGRGRIYLCTTESESMGSSDGWEDGWGYPGKRPLLVDAQRQRTAVLAIGRRAEHAQWFEDAIGNRHHFGPMGTTTLYALSQDGRRLAFTDNGLPNDFTRDLCPPDDGRFEAQAMSASASAILLIDRFGRVVTRFDDYDLNGGTPNFEYTYRSEVRADDQGDAFLTSLTPYYLPLSPWRWHAPPALSGAARLSRDVTVLQTGEGNATRELRVAGLNADGRTGYYAKGIEAEVWAFVASDEVLSDRSRVLDPADVAFGAAEFARTSGDLSLSVAPRGMGVRRRWSGTLSSSAKDGPETPMDGVRVSMDFSGLCSPAQLGVEVEGARFTVALHTVDLWTPMQRQHPGDDGSPQWWLGTLVLEDAVLADRRPAVRRVVEVLRRHHHDVFGLLVERVGDRLELVSLAP